MLFREAEGWTVIMGQHVAETHHLAFTFPCRMITLNVHSSLEAVGFLAAITRALARLQIGVNPVSGFFHDHLFVPVGREAEVMRALEAMTTGG